MSWEELGGLAERGWEIGSHTCSHPHLTELDDASLDDELRRSQGGLRGPPRPRLRLDRLPVRRPRRCASSRPRGAPGTGRPGTLPSRMDSRDPLRWPRVGIYYGDDLRRFQAKVSPLVRGLRASRAWEAADRILRRGR